VRMLAVPAGDGETRRRKSDGDGTSHKAVLDTRHQRAPTWEPRPGLSTAHLVGLGLREILTGIPKPLLEPSTPGGKSIRGFCI
jgi:hypothetical protein